MHTKRTYLRQFIAALLCTVIYLYSFSAAYAEKDALTIDRVPCPAGCRVLALRGDTELCLIGPEEALQDETIREILAACDRGETYTLTAPALVDAEKSSNRLYGSLPGVNGEWLEQDDLWGDKSLCWAASVSNLLVISGWSQQSTEKTGNEDQLFELFTHSFLNAGGYQKDGIQWFFEGETDGQTYPLEPGTPRVIGEKARDYVRFASLSAEDDDCRPFNEVCSLILSLKTGAAVGINVEIDTPLYPIQGQGEPIYTKNGIAEIIALTDEAEEHLYTYTPEGRVHVLPDDTRGKYVIRGLVHQDEEDGDWYPVGNYPSAYWYLKSIRTEPSLLDLSKPYRLNEVGNGAHALTVNGYVTQRGELTGLFITDSDDDAAIWVFTPENESKEGRPNRCTLFPVTRRVLTSGKETWCLQGYAGGEALIANVTTLSPAPFSYRITRGADQSVPISAKKAEFASNADYANFVRVEVDGKTLKDEEYESRSETVDSSGSTVIVLTENFLKKCSVGTHTLRIVSTDGSASTHFMVLQPLPKTGDTAHPMLLLVLLLVCLGTMRWLHRAVLDKERAL